MIQAISGRRLRTKNQEPISCGSSRHGASLRGPPYTNARARNHAEVCCDLMPLTLLTLAPYDPNDKWGWSPGLPGRQADLKSMRAAGDPAAAPRQSATPPAASNGSPITPEPRHRPMLCVSGRVGSRLRRLVRNLDSGPSPCFLRNLCMTLSFILSARENQLWLLINLVQARIDGAVKEEATAVLAAMGLTVSDAVRLLLIRVAQEKALPFAPLIPNAVTSSRWCADPPCDPAAAPLRRRSTWRQPLPAQFLRYAGSGPCRCRCCGRVRLRT